MKPSRLDTMCKVTRGCFATPSLRDIVPPRLRRDPVRWVEWNGAFVTKRIVQEICCRLATATLPRNSKAKGASLHRSGKILPACSIQQRERVCVCAPQLRSRKCVELKRGTISQQAVERPQI